jgi:short-chain fatty acids transporter
MPHPFVFAILLTGVTYVLGLTWGGAGPGDLIGHWFAGMWEAKTMVFILQMALILITGHALAATKPIRSVLERLARLVRGTGSAAVLTSLVAMLAALVNWGLGLIVGALLALYVARSARRRGVVVHYPLVVAAGYTGLLVWHGGLSGSAPLSIATPDHLLASTMGVIPVTETVFSSLNFTVTLFLLLTVPTILFFMAPRGEAGTETVERMIGPAEDPEPAPPGPSTPAARLEQSRFLVWVIVLGGVVFLFQHLRENGLRGVDLNTLNFTFLMAGLLLHGSPRRYAETIDDAAKGAGGILLQFPFYFGIMGMMKGAGLVERLANVFVSWAGTLAEAGLPVGSVHAVLTFASAAIVNFFVPSGGGQWAVQGPIAVETASQLSTQLPTTVMALAYGDELTNMLQPFWALPLLAITGLEARQIVGYTALLMLLVTPGMVLFLALFGA